MADYTLADFAQGAQNNTQTGIARDLYFFRQSDVSTITLDPTTREVDAITLVTDAEAVHFEINNDEAIAEFEPSGGTSTYGTQRITFALDGVTAANRKALQALDKSTGVACLAILANGQRLLLGYDCDTTDADDRVFACTKMHGGSMSTGTKSDGSTTVVNRYQRIYSWMASNEPLFVESAFDLSVFTAPAA